jgi:hypothetical protein
VLSPGNIRDGTGELIQSTVDACISVTYGISFYISSKTSKKAKQILIQN